MPGTVQAPPEACKTQEKADSASKHRPQGRARQAETRYASRRADGPSGPVSATWSPLEAESSLPDRAAVATRGLQDIVAGITAVSMVDPAGRLVYRGFEIGDLAEHATYEEVAHLLLVGRLPDRADLARFREALAGERALSPFLLQLVGEMAKGTPMDALRTVVSATAREDPDEGDNSHEANVRKSIRLTAKMPTIVAAYMRRRRGEEPIAPDPSQGHAANFARMAFGDSVPREAEQI